MSDVQTVKLMDRARRHTPWGRIGMNFPADSDISVPDAFNLAGLDWTVSKRQAYFKGNDGNDIEIEGKYALVNDANQKPLEVVANRYEPLQNATLARHLDQARSWGPVETVGVAGDHGQNSFVVFRGSEFDITSRNLARGDVMRHYTCVRDSKQLGIGLSVAKYVLRLVCLNGTIHAESRSIFEASLKHVKGIDSMTAYLAEIIGLMAEVDRNFERSCTLMADKALFDHEAEEIWQAAFPLPQPGSDLKRLESLNERGILDDEGHEMLLTAQLKYQNGLELSSLARNTCKSIYGGEIADQGAGGTAWGALQAVTAYCDHRIALRPKVAASSAIFGIHADAKVRAYKQAMAFSKN